MYSFMARLARNYIESVCFRILLAGMSDWFYILTYSKQTTLCVRGRFWAFRACVQPLHYIHV
jgi:hypothetical protein